MDPSDPRFRRPEPTPALVRTPAPAPGPGSAAARAYRVQLTRITRLKSQLAELDALAQAHRQALHQRVHPLQVAHRQHLRAMALLIDERLAGKALAAPQRRAAVELLCGMAATLARAGDAAMAALHDRHSKRSLAEYDRDASQTLRAQLEAMLGESLGDLPPEASTEALKAAARARLDAQQETERQARQDKTERRRKSKKKPEATAAPLTAAEPSGLLRNLFRQLASALHPDRETDPQVRERKTAQMSEANAAYARKDLLALLQLQQDAALAQPLNAQALPSDQLPALTQLLKHQVAELERERAGRQDALCQEFEVPPGLGVTPRTLQSVLLEQVEALEMALALMREDLQRAQTDAGFKRWLREQHRASQHFGR